MTPPAELGGPGWARAPGHGSQGWVEVDRWSKTATSKPASGGSCSVAFDPVPELDLWEIDRIVVSCTSAAATQAVHYLDAVGPQNIVEGTTSGNFDIADENSGIVVEGTRAFLTVWTGAATGVPITAGAIGYVRIQVRVFRRVG